MYVAFSAAFNSTLKGLKPTVLLSQFNLQLESADTVSLCKLVLFSVTIFSSMEKILSLDVFEHGLSELNGKLFFTTNQRWPDPQI